MRLQAPPSLFRTDGTLQITLGTVTWSVSYHHDWKHKATAVILSFSLTCSVGGGILIAIGNRLTRKKEVVEALLRKALTDEALMRQGITPPNAKVEAERRKKGTFAAIGERVHQRIHPHVDDELKHKTSLDQIPLKEMSGTSSPASATTHP